MQVNNVETLFKKTLQESNLSAKQQAVLQVSLTLFAVQGFDRTSTSEIAQAAGVSEGTVFKQFKTKAGILKAILNPILDQVVPMVATEFLAEIKATEFKDLQSLLQYVLQDRMTFAIENQQQLKVFVQEMIRNPELMTALATKVEQAITGPIGKALQQFKDQGQLVAWPNVRIARYVMGVLVSYVAPQILFTPAETFDVTKASTDAAEFLIRGLTPTK